MIDQAGEQGPDTPLDGIHPHLLVSNPCPLLQTVHVYRVRRDYADLTIPPPFSARVRNALNAEPKSVRLSALVGQGGPWYGFGRMIMRL